MTAIDSISFALAVALAAGCATTERVAPPTDDGDRLPSTPASLLLDGLPDNDALPITVKADRVFPARFDLLDTQSPVRDQGARGTCVKFAIAALVEHLHPAFAHRAPRAPQQ